MSGTGNLPYKLSLIKNALCAYHVLLDNDNAGRLSFTKAMQAGLISVKTCTMTNCQGMPDSEFEDCIDPAIYQDGFLHKYGVNLSVREFRGNKKWSERIKASFQTQGKPWDDNVEKEAKAFVADAVAANPASSLHQNKRQSVDALVLALENLIQS
jgi:hypothetical protein